MIGFHPRECSKSQLSLLAALVFAQCWRLWVWVGEKEPEGKDQSLPSGTPQSALMSQHSMQGKTVTVMDDALLNTDSDVHFSFPVVAMERLTP